MDVTVLHLEEDNKGKVTDVVDMTAEDTNGDAEINTTSENEIQKVTITTNSFSTFAITYSNSKHSEQTTALPTVATVDSRSKGITMRMIDYAKPAEGLNIGGAYTEDGKTGTIKQNLLKRTLTNGYPVTRGGVSLKTLFSDGTDVNHLFLQSTYDASGEYEYSCFNNYAYLNNNGDFTVYDAIGTPDNKPDYLYCRGNFMPYNNIVSDKKSSYNNAYDENGNRLTEADSGYDRDLYLAQGKINYYFGMYVEANFVQPKDGKATKTGQNMRYEFNGDDDMWIYIDNVLALDIGGIHNAHSGYIDFATGEIGWWDCVTGGTPRLTKTTIKSQFKAAGYFPDGNKWNDANVDKYFKGDTFVDYGSHNFKMFYMERGAGASNLHMKFNLEVIPEGTIEVEKQLTNTDKQKYSDVEFGFIVYAQEIANIEANGVETYKDTYVPLTDAVYNKGNRTGQTVTAETVTYDGVSYDNVFKLKPDESIQISGLQKNRKYYVEEVGVQASQYDKITINGKDYVNEEGTTIDWSEGSATVGSRPCVICQNNCSAKNSRELLITKQMANGQTTNDTFDFKIQLSNDHNELVPYANGEYYLYKYEPNDNGENVKVYYRYDEDEKENLVRNGTTAVACGTTDAEGKVFGVPVGYTVAITGILSSTNFKVTEEGLNNQLYQTPSIKVTDYENATVEGADGTIKLGEDAKVTVTNSLKERLQVEKVWSGTAPSATVFVGLYKDGRATAQYKALNAKNDFKGLFDGLDDGTYTVKELRATQDGEKAEFTIDGQGYVGLSDGDEVTFNNTKYKVIYGEKIQDKADRGLYKIQITNAAAWQLRKISSNSTDETKLGLADAEFTLVKDDTTIYAKSYEDGFVKFYEYKDFTTEVKYLKDGRYTVTEVKAPTGYALNSTGWTVVVENGVVNKMTAGSAPVTSYTKNGVTTFDMTNTPIYSLPNSGGSGIYWFSICGMLLMMAAAWIIYKNKCREVLVK